ncbi:ABC transporter ATP-binding protein [Ornithinimicrobium tianjinense]|uniref:ABC transporter domain-containing protein n=1 Tax=Ornithinimicrobium tianjinense TaxID=1195761 RepID=A0A917BPJ7_9MICO|nr:ABC transporter ATP-binding protein [Ornithinimicrobium tianjinense]GGF51918.1 hypothetical protein GCM10011366_19740 [Ornithinimicrobium tianjinense]
MSAPPGSLQVRALSWQVAGRLIVDDVRLDLTAGAVTGIVGPNGSGKTSLLHLLAGLLVPTRGEVLLDGRQVRHLRPRERGRRIALVEQKATTDLELRGREVVALGRYAHAHGHRWRPAVRRSATGSPATWPPTTGRPTTWPSGTGRPSPWPSRTGRPTTWPSTTWPSRTGRPSPWPSTEDDAVARALALADVTHLADRRWSTLSGGEQQRLHLARALAQEPDVLLLDEPTNHLDLSHQIDLLQRVRELGRTTVVVLHDLDLAAATCDDLVVMDDGRVVRSGPTADVLQPGLLEDVFAVRTSVRHEDRLRVLWHGLAAKRSAGRTCSVESDAPAGLCAHLHEESGSSRRSSPS